MNNIVLSDEEKIKCGQYIAEFFKIKTFEVVNKEKRYYSIWGSKTALGLYNSLERIISEGTNE